MPFPKPATWAEHKYLSLINAFRSIWLDRITLISYANRSWCPRNQEKGIDEMSARKTNLTTTPSLSQGRQKWTAEKSWVF